MKKNVIKTAIAAVCVAAAGMGGMKAYNAANQSESNMLLAENVEALTAGESLGDCVESQCGFGAYESCYYDCGSIHGVCGLAYNKNLY
ncbi:MAG: NVEALA domain-containing protein [Prevotellaceae bacterium]|nr:NVEALA domain-containing protein [Prevotellaceae bacterium]